MRGLVPGWAFTSIRYFLSKPVMDVAMYVLYSDDSWLDTERFEKVNGGEIPDEVILFMVNHNFYDEDAAPPGKQVLVSGTVCSSNPDAKEIETLWKKMNDHMQEHFPEIWEATERMEFNGPKEIRDLTRDSVIEGQGGECVGLAQIVGQCGAMKPDIGRTHQRPLPRRCRRGVQGDGDPPVRALGNRGRDHGPALPARTSQDALKGPGAQSPKPLRSCSASLPCHSPKGGFPTSKLSIQKWGTRYDSEPRRPPGSGVPLGAGSYSWRRPRRSARRPRTPARSHREATSAFRPRPALTQPIDSVAESGAPDRIRTCDLRFRKPPES